MGCARVTARTDVVQPPRADHAIGGCPPGKCSCNRVASATESCSNPPVVLVQLHGICRGSPTAPPEARGSSRNPCSSLLRGSSSCGRIRCGSGLFFSCVTCATRERSDMPHATSPADGPVPPTTPHARSGRAGPPQRRRRTPTRKDEARRRAGRGTTRGREYGDAGRRQGGAEGGAGAVPRRGRAPGPAPRGPRRRPGGAPGAAARRAPRNRSARDGRARARGGAAAPRPRSRH